MRADAGGFVTLAAGEVAEEVRVRATAGHPERGWQRLGWGVAGASLPRLEGRGRTRSARAPESRQFLTVLDVKRLAA